MHKNMRWPRPDTLPPEDTLTCEVSEASPTQSKLYACIEGETTESVPMGITEMHHPAMDDARATTTSSGSGGKNVDWEKSQSSTSQVAIQQPALTREAGGSTRTVRTKGQ